MEMFIRRDAFAYRASKIDYAWMIAYFDGVVPTGWDALPFELGNNAEQIFNNCKAAQMLDSGTGLTTLELQNTGRDSAFLAPGRFSKYGNIGWKVIPSKVTDTGVFLDPIAENSFYQLGKEFNLCLATQLNAQSFYSVKPNLAALPPLEFEFNQEISPSHLMISAHSDYRHTPRSFNLEAYDSEVDTWVNVLSGNNYNVRGQDHLYELPQSTSTKYRINFTENTYINAPAYLNEIAFIVKDKPTILESFVPTWALVFPTRQKAEDNMGQLPAVLVSVSDVGGSGELLVDRSSYEPGQPVIALNPNFQVEHWETV